MLDCDQLFLLLLFVVFEPFVLEVVSLLLCNLNFLSMFIVGFKGLLIFSLLLSLDNAHLLADTTSEIPHAFFNHFLLPRAQLNSFSHPNLALLHVALAFLDLSLIVDFLDVGVAAAALRECPIPERCLRHAIVMLVIRATFISASLIVKDLRVAVHGTRQEIFFAACVHCSHTSFTLSQLSLLLLIKLRVLVPLGLHVASDLLGFLLFKVLLLLKLVLGVCVHLLFALELLGQHLLHLFALALSILLLFLEHLFPARVGLLGDLLLVLVAFLVRRFVIGVGMVLGPVADIRRL